MTRAKWADMAKAIAIVAVVVGHTSGIPSLLSRTIFSFHMPLFFLISGYFMKDVTDVSRAVKKDARGLLLPYAFTCGLITCIAAVVALCQGNDVWNAVKTWVLAALYGSGGPIPPCLEGTVRWIGALWFLLALFLAKLILYLTQPLGKYQGIVVLLIAYVGYATTDLLWLPFSVQAAMCAAGYLYLGKLIGKYDWFNKSFHARNAWLYAAVPAVWAICCYYCGTLYMVRNFYGHGLLDVIGSVCATFTIVWVCMLIERYVPSVCRVLSYIGSITLAILCAHITELNVFPWQSLYQRLGISRSWPLDLLLRSILIAVMCLAFAVIPGIRQFYFPKRHKKVEKTA